VVHSKQFLVFFSGVFGISFTPKLLAVHEGYDVTLECTPGSKKDVDITFKYSETQPRERIYENGEVTNGHASYCRMVRSPDGKFKFIMANVTVNDSGIYCCIAQSGSGKSVCSTVFVIGE
jgi:hypothetical protein